MIAFTAVLYVLFRIFFGILFGTGLMEHGVVRMHQGCAYRLCIGITCSQDGGYDLRFH